VRLRTVGTGRLGPAPAWFVAVWPAQRRVARVLETGVPTAVRSGGRCTWSFLVVRERRAVGNVAADEDQKSIETGRVGR